MLHHASNKLTRTLCAIGITIAAMAQTTLAEIVVQGTPILRPSIVWPNDFAQWGTNYNGNPATWADQSGTTSFEQEYGLIHSYDPNTMTLSLDNAYDEDKTKHVWIRLLFNWQENYPAAIGQQPDPAHWATMEVETEGDQNRTPTLTGAAWFHNPIAGQLIIEQSWSIHPQPYNETINLSNIIGNAGGPNAFIGLMSETVCIPAPSACALLALGGLAVARRRRA
jgi:hypothetical protein